MSDVGLDRLRDIHLPPPVGWWPPAPGWWLLALLAIAAIAGWLYARRRAAKRYYRRAALRQAGEDFRRWQHDADAAAYADRCQRLLKETALTAYPREAVAALSGDAWLQFLDRQLRRPTFTQPPLDRLAHHYRADTAPPDPAQLHAATVRWIRRHR